MENNVLNDSVLDEQVSLSAEATNVTAEKTHVSNEEADVDALSIVDFSDEDASMDSSVREYDLGDENEDIDGSDVATMSSEILTGKSKNDLINIFKDLLESKPIQGVRKDAEAIKIAFYKNHRQEIEVAKKLFVEAGGKVEEFRSEIDNSETALKELFSKYRSKRDQFLKEVESAKEKSYAEKLVIIEELKELINSNETINHTFNVFRDLQNRWKESGSVPKAYIKDLWETYHLHIENFYNFVKINKELRDLDLKKNYEIKLELCEKAEMLVLDENIVVAFQQLQKCHEQWRECGPVAVEYKEQLWDRFKEASSKINKKHQEFFDQIKDEQRRNLLMKTELCDKTESIINVEYLNRKDWNKASEELIEIQKVWKTIGFAPKKENAKIYERFRIACDKFFEKKRDFYLNIKNDMENNLQAKISLCVQAEAIAESTDWKNTTNEIISLQNQWKNIGPVSRKQSDMVWKRFRSACDKFFENKSKHYSDIDSVYGDNLVKKLALLEEIKAFVPENTESGFEVLKQFQRRWTEIGFVPIKNKEALQKEYRTVIDTQFARLRGNDKERKMERFKDKVSNMRSNSPRRMPQERERLYNKVKQLESDITLWENNIGFFANSKNAQSMIEDVNNKIARAKEEIIVAIEKINMIDNNNQ